MPLTAFSARIMLYVPSALLVEVVLYSPIFRMWLLTCAREVSNGTAFTFRATVPVCGPSATAFTPAHRACVSTSSPCTPSR